VGGQPPVMQLAVQPPMATTYRDTVEIPSRGKSSIQGRASIQGKELIVQGRELTVESTAYTWTGCKTFSETWPQEGVTVAVDNQKIKVGSKIFIKELNGWFVGEDLIPPESVAKGAVVDIYMGHRENDARKWGRRDVRVIVVPGRGDN
jgi:3D (Asp-Asp-Asp) domain-containing protein